MRTEEELQKEEAAKIETAEELNTQPKSDEPQTRRPWRRAVAFLLAVTTIACGGWLYSLRAGRKSDRPSEGDGEGGSSLYGQIVDPSRAEYSYEEMAEDLRLFAEQYPSLVRVSTAGKTFDGREIYYADFGRADAPRQIFVSAGIHGREYLTPLLAMKMLEYYLHINTVN